MRHMISSRSHQLGFLLLLGTTALPQLAYAQAAATGAAPSEASAADDANEQASQAQSGEIVVTARRREESLIDVPVAVTALSGAQLEAQGLRDVEDLYGRVPSLFFSVNRQFSSGKDNTFLVVRGVGANPALEPSVGIFIDGIYQPAVGFDTSFLDLERVELLRGPQGALFGRSTEGGALNIITRKPGRDFRASASLRVDDLPSAYASASVSGPVADDLFVGLSVMGYGTHGFIHNRTTDKQQNADSGGTARLAVRYEPSAATTIDFSADGTFKRGTELDGGVPLSFGPESYDVDFDFGGKFRSDNGGASLVVTHDFDDIRLSSLSGYRLVKSDRGSDFDAGAIFVDNIQSINTRQEVLSQEFRLQSTSNNAFGWLVGAYAFSQDDRNFLHTDWATYFGPEPGSADVITTINREGYALFGSVNLTGLAGILDLAAGVRYSHERVKARKYNFLDIPAFGLLIEQDVPRRTSFDDVSPNFQATVHIADDITIYSNIARGFKSGGFERYPTTANPFLPLKPETSWNYEVGTKGRAIDGAVTWALAAYRIDIRNQHVPTIITVPETGLPGTAIASAGKAHTEGVEFETTISPVDGLKLRGNLTYTKAIFDDFIDTTGQQRAGDRIPNVPKWIYSIGADYRAPLSDSVDIVSGVNMRHISTYFSGIGTDADSRRRYPPYTIWDADIGVEFGRFTAGLFVRNLTNKYVILNQGFSVDRGDLLRIVDAPRTFGLRLSYRWGN
ncbi:TonB-dependent receptor [Sphingopyxis fribergensis]